MSQQLISHSPDLKKLRDEGYEVETRGPYLLLHNIPYVNSKKEILRGTLVADLTLAGDRTTLPSTHVAFFSGEHPCDKDGGLIGQISHSSATQTLAEGITINHSFSSKPKSGAYADYYEKMATYAKIISAPAQSIDSSVTAQTFAPIGSSEDNDIFNYFDTSSSRSSTSLITDKFQTKRIGIIGLGGTGSYILDFVAKTPIMEIHLFDGDRFLQHNAFRSPGAPSLDQLREIPTKVAYLSAIYSKMHKGIFPHDYYIDSANVGELLALDFAFVCVDEGEVKALVFKKLEEAGIPFIDVGMGVWKVDDKLLAVLRVTTSTHTMRNHVKQRVSLSDGDRDDDYARNIQIADLNALNATMAVIKWKKLFGFYQDLEGEYHSTYSVNTNLLTSDVYNEA